MEPKYEVEYKLSKRYGEWCHTWSIVGNLGGIHVWITTPKNREPYGGFEVHSSTPFCCKHDMPDTWDCWLLHGKCWHDGSSLYASEYWIPLWQSDPHNHERMFDQLRGEMRKRFEQEEEDA